MKVIIAVGITSFGFFLYWYWYKKKLLKELEAANLSWAQKLEKERENYKRIFNGWHDDNRDNLVIAEKLRSELEELRKSEAELKTIVLAGEEKWRNFAEKEILKQKTELEKWKGEELQKEIDKSVNKSRTILRGKTLEHFAPFSEAMKGYSPTDFRFIGSPFDFVIIKGAGEVSDGVKEEIEEVIIADIKTGNSTLSKLQKAIKKAVEEKKIRWMTIKID